MFSVEIECVRCRKSFTKKTASLALVDQTWRAFSHCDGCEAFLTRTGQPCQKCTSFRKEPYLGENPMIIPMFKIPKGHTLNGFDVVKTIQPVPSV